MITKKDPMGVVNTGRIEAVTQRVALLISDQAVANMGPIGQVDTETKGMAAVEVIITEETEMAMREGLMVAVGTVVAATVVTEASRIGLTTNSIKTKSTQTPTTASTTRKILPSSSK